MTEKREQDILRARMRHQLNWWKRLVNQAPVGQAAQLKDALLEASQKEEEACRREHEAVSKLAKVQRELSIMKESEKESILETNAITDVQVASQSASHSVTIPPTLTDTVTALRDDSGQVQTKLKVDDFLSDYSLLDNSHFSIADLETSISSGCAENVLPRALEPQHSRSDLISPSSSFFFWNRGSCGLSTLLTVGSDSLQRLCNFSRRRSLRKNDPLYKRLRSKIGMVEAQTQAVFATIQDLARSPVKNEAEGHVLNFQAPSEAIQAEAKLHLQMIEKDDIIKELTAQLQEQQVIIDEALITSSSGTAKADDLEERVTRLERENEAERAEAQRELEVARQQLQQHSVEEAKNSGHEQELRAMRNSLDMATTRCERLKCQCDEMLEERKKLNFAAEEATTRCERLKCQCDELLEERKKLNFAAEEAAQALVTNDKAVIDSVLDRLQASVHSERDVALERILVFARRQAELMSRMVEMDAVKEQVASVKSESDLALEKQSAFARREAEVLAMCEKIRTENDVLKKEKQELGIEVENWSRMFIELGQKHDELMAETHALKKSYAHLGTHRDVLEEEEAEEHQRLHTDMKLEYDALKREVPLLQHQIEELKKVECKDEVEQLRLLTNSQEQDILRARRQAEEHSELLAQITAERDAAKSALAKLAAEKSHEAPKLSASDTLRWAELENLVDEGNAQLNRANERTAAAEARVANLLAERHQLQLDLASFQDEYIAQVQARTPGVMQVADESFSRQRNQERPTPSDDLPTPARLGPTAGIRSGPMRVVSSGSVTSTPSSSSQLPKLAHCVRPHVYADGMVLRLEQKF